MLTFPEDMLRNIYSPKTKGRIPPKSRLANQSAYWAYLESTGEGLLTEVGLSLRSLNHHSIPPHCELQPYQYLAFHPETLKEMMQPCHFTLHLGANCSFPARVDPQLNL